MRQPFFKAMSEAQGAYYKGLAEEMVRFAIHTAETAGMKAIRLHVPKGNVPGILS
jgi:predicted acetyltransferase